MAQKPQASFDSDTGRLTIYQPVKKTRSSRSSLKNWLLTGLAIFSLAFAYLAVSGGGQTVNVWGGKSPKSSQGKPAIKVGAPIVGQSVKQCKQGPKGDIRILCNALKYDDFKYLWAGGHNGAKRVSDSVKSGKSRKFTPLVDCSGLIGVSLYDSFGIEATRNAKDYVYDTRNWQKVSFKNARPGDIMYMNYAQKYGNSNGVDHVVIVYDNSKGNGKLVVFEARTRSGDASEQIRITRGQKYSRFTGSLRYIGKGSDGK